MRRILTATASALAIVAVMGSPARAELEVTVGGYTAFQAAMFDNDTTSLATNDGTRDFQSEAQIVVHADATADNGLQYGAKVAIDASTSDTSNADEVGVYLAGNWGRVEMGDDDGASELVVFAPTVGIGQINGSYDDFVANESRAHIANDRGDHNFTAIDSDDSTKVTYYTPKFEGFQAGISYAPEYQGFGLTVGGVSLTGVGGSSGEVVTTNKDSTIASDVLEFGLGYEGEFSGVMLKAGGNYVTADTVDGAFDLSAAGYGVAESFEDVSAWSVGAQVGYQGFRLGGGYTDNGDSLQISSLTDNNVTSWNAGLTYENGPWGVGVSYLNTDFDTNAYALNVGSGGLGGDYTAWAMGGTYAVAPGLTVGADVAFFDRNAVGTADDNDGYVAMTDVTAAF